MTTEVNISSGEGLELNINDDESRVFLVETICDDGVKVLCLYFGLPDGKVMVTLNPDELKILNEIVKEHGDIDKKFVIEYTHEGLKSLPKIVHIVDNEKGEA